MHNFSVEEDLQRTMSKLSKKDPAMFKDLLEKMDEIVQSENIDHYKNLRSPLQHLQRVHIRGSFVLTFRYLKSEDKVVFYDFDHHDRIYR